MSAYETNTPRYCGGVLAIPPIHAPQEVNRMQTFAKNSVHPLLQKYYRVAEGVYAEIPKEKAEIACDVFSGQCGSVEIMKTGHVIFVGDFFLENNVRFI